MGIFSRFQAIFAARANALADSFEDPKSSLDYSMTRLEESCNQIDRSLIEVSMARHRLQEQRDMLAEAIEKRQQQAEKAIQGEREDLARIALERKQDAELRKQALDADVESLDKQVETLKENRASLERKISLFRSKKEELKAVYDSSQAQLRVRESLTGISTDLADAGNAIQRAEERIRALQYRTQAIEGLINEGILTDVLEPESDDVERELSRIDRQQAIEDELARLKEAA
jgi:phage shock protein A